MRKRSLSALLVLTSLLLAGCASSGPGISDGSSSSSREPRKTYESTKYGIALEYPAHWTVYDDKTNRRNTGEDITFNTGVPNRLEGIRVNDNKRSVKYLIARFDRSVKGKVSAVTVGGEKGERMNLKHGGVSYFFIPHKDHVYVFETQGALLDEGVLDSVRFTQ